ncbi:MAG: hypothetical protein ACOC0T_02225 [Desulfovermiculus sp.]
MLCTHCKYTSFDYLPSCPRCGRDWTGAKKALNLDWVVASAPERRHRRQVPENEDGTPLSALFSDREQSPKEPFGAGHEARPSSSQPHLDSQRQPDVNASDGGEDELDFPDLDTLLYPQSALQSPEQSPPEASNPVDGPGQEKTEPQGPAAEESENEEILDLSSLVHDLGLEVDESKTSEHKPRSSPPGQERKSSNSSLD